MKCFFDKKGYSLIEVLVAVALLMFSIVGPITIAVKSAQSAQYARQQNTAFFLAQEGISIINVIRNDAGLAKSLGTATDSWAWVDDPRLDDCFETYGCNIDFVDTSLLDNVQSCEVETDCSLRFSADAGRVKYQLGEGDPTPYRRVITMTPSTLNTDEVQVTSRVEWETTLLGDTQTISLSTSLFDAFK